MLVTAKTTCRADAQLDLFTFNGRTHPPLSVPAETGLAGRDQRASLPAEEGGQMAGAVPATHAAWGGLSLARRMDLFGCFW